MKVNPEYEAMIPPLSDAEYKTLKESIKQEGLYHAIIVNKDDTVLDGHHRFKACTELGIDPRKEEKTFPDPTHEKLYVIDSNLERRHMKPEQRAILIAMKSELISITHGGDRRSKDFKAQDVRLENIAKEIGVSPRTLDTARAYKRAVTEMPELKKMGSVTTALTEYNRRGNLAARRAEIKAQGNPAMNNLINGDALEEVKKMKDESIDCVVTDPPYGIEFNAVSARWMDAKVKNDDASIFPYMREVAKELYRVMKKDSDLYCFCGWKDSYSNFFSALQDAGFHISNCIVWKKNQRTIGPDFKRRYALFHEFIIYAKKGKRYLNTTFSPDFVEFNKVKDAHVAVQKPLDLLKHLIINSTIEGEVVLDPFAGSGSTLVAAEEIKRKWIGIEIEKKYHEICKIRVTEVQNNGD